MSSGYSEYCMPPVVLDTNVVVAGACRRVGSQAYAVLMAILQQRIPLALTPSIALEYQDVLLRPAVRALTGLTHAQAVDLVTDLIARALQLHLHFEWRPNLHDESDNKFVEAAIHCGGIIVTYNLAHYREPDLPVHGWAVMTPNELLTRYALAR